jgi:type I restriction enzyme, S subunit
MEVKEARATYDALVTVSAGYKHTELGVIPEEWEVCAVRQKGEIITGKALAVNAPGTLRPYLRTKNVFDGRIDIDDVLKMPMTDEQFVQFRIKSGDVLLNEGQSLELVGRCAIYQDEFTGPCAIQNALLRFRARAGVSEVFASHLFRHCQQTGVFARIALQTTSIAHLGGLRFEKLRLAWPKNEVEQRAIAEALSDADALVESLEQLIAKKRQIKQGTTQALLTGRQRLPGFDDNWRRKALSELFDFSGGYSASRDQLSADGHCYLHYGDIHTSSKSFVDVGAESQELPRLDISISKVNANSLLKDGDVVFVDASEDDEGTSKHVVIINKDNAPFISGLHTIVAKSKTDELDHAFRRYCFQTPDIKQQFRFFAVGTKVSGVSKSNIERSSFPFRQSLSSVPSPLSSPTWRPNSPNWKPASPRPASSSRA